MILGRNPTASGHRLAAEDDLVGSLPSAWVCERLGTSEHTAGVLLRSPRVRARIARMLTTKARLEPLSRLPDVLVETLRGYGPRYELLCLKIGLAQALSGRHLIERGPMQDFLAQYGREAVAFAVNWLGRPIASGPQIAVADRDAVVSSGRVLVQTWLAANPSVLGGWPVPGSPIGNDFDATFMPILDEAVSAAMREAVAAPERRQP